MCAHVHEINLKDWKLEDFLSVYAYVSYSDLHLFTISELLTECA